MGGKIQYHAMKNDSGTVFHVLTPFILACQIEEE